MSIERGQAAGPAAAAGSVHGRGAAGKADAAAAGGDFLALLAALDATAPAEAEALVDGAAAGLAGEADEKADPAMLPSTDGLVPPVPVVAYVPSLAPAPQPALASPSEGPGTPLVGGHGAPGVPGADSTPPSTTPDVQRPPPPAAAGPVPTAASSVASGATGAAPSPFGQQYASVLEQMQLKQRLAAQDDVAVAPAAVPVAGRVLQALAEARRDRAGPATAALAVAVAEAPAHDAAAVPDPVRPVGASAAARGDGAGGTALHPQATQEFRPTVQYDNTVGQPAAPQTAAEDALADQIGYWAAQGLRGADFTVRGDADPVQVSIALTGNEARVEFRSEHAATRDWLAASTDQLRELLQREGVVLAGVSVGAQQTGQSPPQSQQSQRPPAEGGRRAAGVPRPVDATAAATPGVPRAPTGSVDLFV